MGIPGALAPGYPENGQLFLLFCGGPNSLCGDLSKIILIYQAPGKKQWWKMSTIVYNLSILT